MNCLQTVDMEVVQALKKELGGENLLQFVSVLRSIPTGTRFPYAALLGPTSDPALTAHRGKYS